MAASASFLLALGIKEHPGIIFIIKLKYVSSNQGVKVWRYETDSVSCFLKFFINIRHIENN